jgi:molybdopterin/thiamine biosynthesis adenylyltransferase
MALAMTSEDRYSRQLALFGAEGQARIAESAVAVVGLGGLGSHLAQQLAYLGVQRFALVDADLVEVSNLNRLIGARPSDVGTAKVEVAARMVGEVQPEGAVRAIQAEFQPEVLGLDTPAWEVLFGCVDNDAARLELLRYCSAHALPYIDLASDIAPGGEFGGRVIFAKDGERCLACLDELDQHALARARMSEEQRAADDRIYGINRDALDGGGPSVVGLNGVVASLAVTEFMAWRTGLREPIGYLNYRGDRGTVGVRQEPERAHCYYCMTIWGTAGEVG